MKKNLNKKKRKGFTLVELIAVIAILGILAAAFVPKIGGFIKESKKVAVLNEATKVVAAYESLKIRSNTAVSDTDSISTLISKSSGLLASTDIDKINTDVSIATCIKIVNTEKYTFTLSTDNKLTSESIITDLTKTP